MSYKVVILPLAKNDIEQAVDWYQQIQNKLGKRFTAEVRKKVKFIRKNPKATAIRYKNVRTALLDKFPFLIHYVVDDAGKTIIIAAVFHTSLNPDIWDKR